MTIKHELTIYAQKCISGEIVSCTKHKWACQRFLNDLERAKRKDCPFEWNEEEAQKIVKWFSYLRHSKGELAGKPINIITAQKFHLCQIYGWKKTGTNLRRFNKSYTQKGRKNAKSQEEAGVALYELSYTSVKNSEVNECYCAGTKSQQSKLVFNEAALMLKGSPLAVKFHCSKTEIRHKKSGSYFIPLSKDDGKNGDGTNPALLILDEYHLHPTSEFYDLELGANTKEPLLMIITTAGKDLNVPCYTDEYAYCSDILNPDKPDIVNDEYFVDIYEAEPGIRLTDETYEQLVAMSNPVRASYPEGRKKIHDEYVIAKQVPSKMTSFLTKVLDVWVQAKDGGYMDMAKWNKCKVSELPIDIKGLPVYVGFDMSAKIDLTSVAFIIPYKDGDIVKYILFSHSFIPNKDRMQEHIAVDKMPYDAWERNGLLTVTDTEVVDQNQVMDYVREFCKKNELRIEKLCFDPDNATKLMLELSEEYEVVEVYQSHKSLNESTKTFREEVFKGNVIFINNPLLNYAMGNAVVKSNRGLIKIDKDATRKRIDPVDATLCAFKLALYHDFEVESYSDEWLDS
ncbi:MAG: terminase large subunit [Clostridia bacterium]|nr:terminase large subunit [Clostridia bacterium]